MSRFLLSCRIRLIAYLFSKPIRFREQCYFLSFFSRVCLHLSKSSPSSLTVNAPRNRRANGILKAVVIKYYDKFWHLQIYDCTNCEWYRPRSPRKRLSSTLCITYVYLISNLRCVRRNENRNPNFFLCQLRFLGTVLLLITLDIVYYVIIVRKKFYKNLPAYTLRIHISVYKTSLYHLFSLTLLRRQMEMFLSSSFLMKISMKNAQNINMHEKNDFVKVSKN